jgi:hypothetical protein
MAGIFVICELAVILMRKELDPENRYVSIQIFTFFLI